MTEMKRGNMRDALKAYRNDIIRVDELVTLSECLADEEYIPSAQLVMNDAASRLLAISESLRVRVPINLAAPRVMDDG